MKLKNLYQSDKQINHAEIPEEYYYNNSVSKPLSLPQVAQQQSFNSTKSELTSILTDRKTFVNKYF